MLSTAIVDNSLIAPEAVDKPTDSQGLFNVHPTVIRIDSATCDGASKLAFSSWPTHLSMPLGRTSKPPSPEPIHRIPRA